MNPTVKVGMFMFVVLVLAGILIVKIEDIAIGGAGKVREVPAVFDSVAGLDEKSAVRVAGIRVGKVARIELDGVRARAILSIEDPDVELRLGASARIVNMGLLGDKYVELVPGSPDAPLLAEGTALRGTVPVGLDQLADSIGAVADDVKAVTSSLRKAMGGIEGEQRVFEIVENIHATTANLRAILEENRTGVSATVANFEHFSADLRREVPNLAKKIDELATNLNAVVNENRANVKDGIADAKVLVAKLQNTADNLNQITDKIASGEGTLGKLVNSDEAHDKLTGALDSVSGGVEVLTDTLGKLKTTRFDMGLETAYHEGPEDTRAGFSMTIYPKDTQRYYQAGVVKTPGGIRKTKEETITTTYPDGSVETIVVEKTKYEDRFGLNASVGWNFDQLGLRAGLIESQGGFAADYRLLNDKLAFTFEAFDFGREIDDEKKRAHLRLTGRWRLSDNVFLTAGYDDPLADENKSVFVGGGVVWTDEHLKYLLGSLPTP